MSAAMALIGLRKADLAFVKWRRSEDGKKGMGLLLTDAALRRAFAAGWEAAQADARTAVRETVVGSGVHRN